MSAVLETRSLKKTFGAVQAVVDVSLSVQRGEIFGFLGPNGAGKTTTIGMILGLLHPTAGEVRLFGEPVTPFHTAPLQRVGALFGAQATLVPYLSARDHLRMSAQLYGGADRRITDQRIAAILDRVGLSEAASRSAGQFSTGMKQRLGLGMALLHNPELLVLDEPTNGMDPEGMRHVRNLIRSLADNGTTVFLSSHLLHEIEQVADRVAILSHGRVVALDSVQTLLAGAKGVRIRVPDIARAVAALRRLPGVAGVEPNGSHIDVAGLPSETIATYLIGEGIIPSEITTSQNDLEEVFLQVTHEAQ
ncbi:MAG: ABC transporter ATP-binding protein [Chloroflexi bacterium]|nr:ABC transporter ATP-binding protein [Chloroflexota bacterium]